MKIKILITAALATLTSAKPLDVKLLHEKGPVNDPILPRGSIEVRNGRQQAICQEIKNYVDLLRLNGATPFCSSFLAIRTRTQTVTGSAANANAATVTFTQTATITRVDRTIVDSFTVTTTDATVPTTVATVTITQASTSTITQYVTPSAVIIPTTVYTTPGAARRRTIDIAPAAVEKRGLPVLHIMVGFNPGVISQACSCFSIPTPVTTITARNTYASTATVTFTSTQTKAISTEISITETIHQTSYVPITISTTVTPSTTTTITVATPTQTQTVYVAIPPQCQNILSGQKLWGTLRSYRMLNYASIPSMNVPDTELGWSICCTVCYNDLPNCNQYVGYLLSDGTRDCSWRVATDVQSSGVTAQCPNGVASSPTKDRNGQPAIGYGLGPCFGGQ
ncbi:hypothetical protein TWF694_008049 [Orbilia ellipsospora]|uniref:Apple domain-containing protein n=1 Tax=Orbilia ellipsospora TaxID=2528407 RepID=A0AAV9XG72_9PEZI